MTEQTFACKSESLVWPGFFALFGLCAVGYSTTHEFDLAFRETAALPNPTSRYLVMFVGVGMAVWGLVSLLGGRLLGTLSPITLTSSSVAFPVRHRGRLHEVVINFSDVEHFAVHTDEGLVMEWTVSGMTYQLHNRNIRGRATGMTEGFEAISAASIAACSNAACSNAADASSAAPSTAA